MRASLRALLAGSIDYAGLFPPAALSMADASGNFVRYQQTAEHWMLARFVCPAARLAELASVLPPAGHDLRVALLIDSGASSAEVLNRLEALLAIDLASPLLARCDVVELRLPADLARRGGAELEHFIMAVIADILSAGVAATAVFFEVPLAAGESASHRRRLLAHVTAALAAYNCCGTARCRAGLKLRTGGLDAAAFPTSEALADTIAACRAAGVAWKATAGLHHPLRHHDAEIGTRMHGFLNVLAAAVLANVHQLAANELVPILEEIDAASFGFSDASLAWSELSATTDQIAAARGRSLVSIGSCSFDEPRQDLGALGLL